MRYPMKFTALPLVAGLSALAAGTAFVLAAPGAKAACLDAASVCSTFDPATATNVINRPVTGSVSAQNNASKLVSGGIQFNIGSSTPLTYPFSFTNVVVNNVPTGGANATFNIGTVTFNSDADLFKNFPTPLTSITNRTTAANFTAAGTTVSFTIPAGIFTGATSISSSVIYQRQNLQIANSDEFSMSNVPGPLPILGAASAFGFSRSLRRRIKLAKAA